jgi:branched-subunit amino acid transport protein
VNWQLILLLGVITYASRAAALVLLPSLPERVRDILDRMPTPIFAGLAVHSIVTAGGTLVDAPTLAGAAAAVLAAPLRSFPVCLLAGVAGYLAWGLTGLR